MRNNLLLAIAIILLIMLIPPLMFWDFFNYPLPYFILVAFPEAWKSPKIPLYALGDLLLLAIAILSMRPFLKDFVSDSDTLLKISMPLFLTMGFFLFFFIIRLAGYLVLTVYLASVLFRLWAMRPPSPPPVPVFPEQQKRQTQQIQKITYPTEPVLRCVIHQARVIRRGGVYYECSVNPDHIFCEECAEGFLEHYGFLRCPFCPNSALRKRRR